eukprot:3887207-Rhodomonas_salina.1
MWSRSVGEWTPPCALKQDKLGASALVTQKLPTVRGSPKLVHVQVDLRSHGACFYLHFPALADPDEQRRRALVVWVWR